MYVIYVISQRHLYRLLECGPCVVIGDRDKSDNTPAAALATAHILHMKLQNSRNSNIWNFNTITLYGDVDIISISFTISPFKKNTIQCMHALFHSILTLTHTHTQTCTLFISVYIFYTLLFSTGYSIPNLKIIYMHECTERHTNIRTDMFLLKYEKSLDARKYTHSHIHAQE